MTEPEFDLEQHERMRDEWEAWRIICVELTRCSAAVDINEEPRLHAALVYWGEAMGNLRRHQNDDDCERWRLEALDKLEAKVKL